MQATEEAVGVPTQAGMRKGAIGATVTRLALGFTTLFTWFDNISKDFYDGANFPGFFNDYLFVSAEDGGNGSQLFFVQDILLSLIHI